jgi:ABC-type transport system involved in multi-copper enzyme maturation permease subunit
METIREQANTNAKARDFLVSRMERRGPGSAPVAWRERNLRSAGSLAILSRLFLAAQLFYLLVMLFYVLSFNGQGVQATARFILSGSWVVMLLVTCVTAASLIPRERQQQTLISLLTTPISGADLLRQKLAGVRRFLWHCQLPMWISLGFLLAMWQQPKELQYVMEQASMLLIYPWVVMWLSMRQGLESSTQVDGVLKSFLVYGSICWIPYVVVYPIFFFLSAQSGPQIPWMINSLAMSTLLSPMTLLTAPETRLTAVARLDLAVGSVSLLWVINACIHGLILYRVRRNCLLKADWLLGRLGAETEVSQSADAAT